MIIVLYISILLILCFGFVIIFGAPYLPTKKRQIQSALDLLELKKGETLLELGCGDGRVLRAAANRGIKAIGYEINPLLFVIAKIVNYRYKNNVTVKLQNYWNAELPKVDGIYVFLLEKFMVKLDKKIQNSKLPPIKLASYAFKISNKKIQKSRDGVFLYEYK